MDRSDKKTSEFERRASRRLSRGVSIHARTDTSDAIDNDAYLAAMAMTVSDGFRPYTETMTAPSAGTPGAHHSISLRTKDADDNHRSDVASSASYDDDHLSATPAAGAAASSISTDPFSSSSSSSFSSSASAASSPTRTFATPSSSQLPNAPIPAADSPASSESSEEPASSSNPPLPVLSQIRSLTAARPSSIAKPPIDHLPRSGLYDGSSEGSSRNARPLADVRASASSSVAPAHEEEPYEGPSGPSFPYQMFPQNVRMASTLSGVTTSTVAPSEETYNGPRGPTFPYAMFPQSTMAGPSAMPAPVPGMPVGFPGMADNYQRRIGPDGEDVADLIGPDGHTEQLPPYTKYPDEAYNRKIAAANAPVHRDPLADPLADPMANQMSAPNTVPVAVPVSESLAAQSVPPASASVPAPAPAAVLAPVLSHLSTSPGPIAPIPGAGGIGLAPRNPEFDGAEEVESPRSRHSLRSFNSDGSGHEINTAAGNINEKRRHRAPHCIQKYGGRRLLGIIPYWAICLVFTALLIMAIVLGSVIGTFVAKHRKAQRQRHPNDSPVSITITVDATPIPTPANLASLPTGTFGLPFAINKSQDACFNDTTQAQAWQCSITNHMSMTLTINSLPRTPDGPMYNISINCNESATYENNVFYYGEQPPTINTLTPMQLVNDTLDPSRGPAWFKLLPYTKTVIVRESDLSVPGSQPTTSASSKTNANNRRGHADLTGSFNVAGPFGRKAANVAQVGEKPWVCSWPDTILEVFIYPNQNSSTYQVNPSSTYTALTTTPTPKPSPSHTSLNGAAVTTTTGEPTSSATPSAPTRFPSMLPPYPRVVKMEERRMANSPAAVCVQYELKAVGSGLKAVPALDNNKKPIQITIAENESGPSLFSQGKRDLFAVEEMFDKRDDSGLSKCGCLWMVA